MEQGQESDERGERSIAARLGISALNLLLPGLGLLRLSNWRAAAWFVTLQFLALALIWSGYAVIDHMTFGIYLALFALGIGVILATYIWSIVHSWRSSIKKSTPQRWFSRWYVLFATWLAAGIATASLPDILRSYYRSFSVPSVSMVPTFATGDRFLAKMSRYGALERGDVVIVRSGSVSYVKRIAAVPGDRIAMTDGLVSIDGKPAILRNTGKTEAGARIFEEVLPGERGSHRIVEAEDGIASDYHETRLGPDQFFLLGDNRSHSADSRFDVDQGGLGLVPRRNITGKPIFIFWRNGFGWGEKTI